MNIQIKTTDLAILNSRAVIGNNQPPTCIPPTCVDTARGVYATLADFLKETPVIQTAEEAKRGANLIEQGRATLGEMEDERKASVKPLNDEVDIINDRYRLPRDSIKAIMDELKRRLTAFAAEEEARRQREAQQARHKAEEAERIARKAEECEREAKEDADNGVAGISVATWITKADQAFATFKRADRTAARAEKSIPVRLNGGFGRAVTMRKSETLILDDATTAIAAIGITEKIKDAILSSARDFRKLNGALPAGVSAITERQF